MAEVLWIGILILTALLAVGIGYGISRSRRASSREDLRRRFGPEYDRAVEETGSGDAARRELRDRVRRVGRLPLRDLSERERADFRDSIADLEAAFVDDPSRAIAGFERLTQQVIAARGYPSASSDRQLADLSVHHARSVGHYRSARSIARSASADPDQLRRALGHYRAILRDLLETPLAHGGGRPRIEKAEYA